jgi:hypothetical protein
VYKYRKGKKKDNPFFLLFLSLQSVEHWSISRITRKKGKYRQHRELNGWGGSGVQL